MPSIASLLLDALRESLSPYINRFLSADTIVPGYANPQNLNRYSYVLNNPLRYTDPTGHMIDDGCKDYGCGSTTPIDVDYEPGGGIGENKNEGSNGVGNSNDLGTAQNGFCPAKFTLTQCFSAELPLYMGEDPMELDPSEFRDLLLAIALDVHQRSPGELVLLSPLYDTPFYDHSIYGIGKYPGTGCIYGKCYSRDELNYVAEGALWARVGVSKAEGHQIVYTWKFLVPILHFPTVTTPATIEMFDVGFDTYQQLYPSSPRPNIPVSEPVWP